LEEEYEERNQGFHPYDFTNCPTWAVSEVMSFGQLSRWYGDTTLPVKKRVAGHYQLHHKVLKPLLHNLSTVRNICAHHQRLWDREIATQFRLPKQLAGVSNSETLFNKAEPSKLYNTLVMMAYLTRAITNSTAWTLRLVDLMDQSPNIPQTTLGFVPGWQELAIWQE
jgi:abortive infection bacteriophage resistance protein